MTQGACGGADEEGKVEGAGGEGESRDTSAPRASAEMAAYTLKGFGVLQVREELADEGKNHADSILVEVRGFELRASCQHLIRRSNICAPQER